MFQGCVSGFLTLIKASSGKAGGKLYFEVDVQNMMSHWGRKNDLIHKGHGDCR